MTDGLENCGYNACALGVKIHADMPQIRVHVIGFDLGNQNEQQIACLATATGGLYVSTNTLEGLEAALTTTLGCPQITSIDPAQAGGRLSLVR